MLARVSAIRRLPQLAVVSRRYASSQVEGSVAQSKGFKYVVTRIHPIAQTDNNNKNSKKEKAHEGVIHYR